MRDTKNCYKIIGYIIFLRKGVVNFNVLLINTIIFLLLTTVLLTLLLKTPCLQISPFSFSCCPRCHPSLHSFCSCPPCSLCPWIFCSFCLYFLSPHLKETRLIFMKTCALCEHKKTANLPPNDNKQSID